jgi:hypothetical protein
MHVRGKVGRQRALTRTALAGSENKNIHAISPKLAAPAFSLRPPIPKAADA